MMLESLILWIDFWGQHAYYHKYIFRPHTILFTTTSFLEIIIFYFASLLIFLPDFVFNPKIYPDSFGLRFIIFRFHLQYCVFGLLVYLYVYVASQLASVIPLFSVLVVLEL